MTELTLELLRAELAPIRQHLDAQDAKTTVIHNDLGFMRAEIDAMRIGQNAMRTEIDAIRAEIDAMRIGQNAMRTEIDAIRAEIDAVRPNIDGIPLLQQAISVIRNDMHHLREEMLVVSNTAMRLDRNRDYHDGTLHDILREMQAVHRVIASIAARVRKLEGVEEQP
jgi:chromosome segregation ATPase